MTIIRFTKQMCVHQLLKLVMIYTRTKPRNMIYSHRTDGCVWGPPCWNEPCRHRCPLVSRMFCDLKQFTWILWYVSVIIAMSRFISTTTETNIYIPKRNLNNTSVHRGWLLFPLILKSEILSWSVDVCPNTAKNSNSKARIGFFWTANIRKKKK